MIDFVIAVIGNAVPLILASVGACYSEKSGIVDLGIEGKILFGAFTAAAVSYSFQSPAAGWLAATLVGILAGLFLGGFTLYLKCNQVVAGMGFNLLGAGMTSVLCKAVYDDAASSPFLEGASKLNHHESYFWIFIGIGVLVFVYHFSRFGLRIRAAGENPEALRVAGVNPTYLRWKAVVISGIASAWAGAFLSTEMASMFVKNMSAGRGYIALAATILGKWEPTRAIAACFFFGLVDTIQIRLQGAGGSDGNQIPVQMIQMLPYILTIAVLAIWVGRVRAPKNLGVD